MSVTAKSLADGQLPDTKGTLYTVPASTKAYIRSFLVYSHGDGQTINLYLKRSGSTSRNIPGGTLDTGESLEIIDEAPIMLSEGDVLEGDTTDASTVDYSITGAEE